MSALNQLQAQLPKELVISGIGNTVFNGLTDWFTLRGGTLAGLLTPAMPLALPED